MRLVFDIRETQLKRVGVSVYANNVMPRLVELLCKRHEIVLIGLRNKPVPFKISSDVIYYDIAPSSRDSKLIKFLWYLQLPLILRRLEADLYFGTFLKIAPLRKFKTKVITTLHDAASLSTVGLVGNKLSRVINKAFVSNSINHSTKIICISEHCRREFFDLFGEKILEKGEVVYHGVPDEFIELARNTKIIENDFRSKHGIFKKFLLSVGTITPKKNYERLIEAFELIQQDTFDLVIIGAKGFDHEKIIRRAQVSTKADSIKILGNLETTELVTAMKFAEYFIFPSLYEGFGLPVLEAFHVGTPVLCSNSTCLPEIAGSAALYFNPESIQEMAQILSKLPLDKIDADTMVDAGKVQVRKFNWDESAELHIGVFEKALGRKLI